MSGGHFDYKQHHITDIINDIEQVILNETNTDYDGPIDGYTEETLSAFKQAVRFLTLAHAYTHRIDWLLSGVEFNIGTGLTAQDRQAIWDNQQNFVGKLAKYKFFPVGIKDKPRHPVFLGWRSNIDIGEVA